MSPRCPRPQPSPLPPQAPLCKRRRPHQPVRFMSTPSPLSHDRDRSSRSKRKSTLRLASSQRTQHHPGQQRKRRPSPRPGSQNSRKLGIMTVRKQRCCCLSPSASQTSLQRHPAHEHHCWQNWSSDAASQPSPAMTRTSRPTSCESIEWPEREPRLRKALRTNWHRASLPLLTNHPARSEKVWLMNWSRTNSGAPGHCANWPSR
jgi:hypothetical protein